MNPKAYLRTLDADGRVITECGLWIFEVWQARQAGRVVTAVLGLGGDIVHISRGKVERNESKRYSFRTAYYIHAVLPDGVL